MKFTRFLLPALLLAGMSVQAKAADEAVPDPITYTVNLENGVLSYSGGSGSYCSLWTSNGGANAITVTSNNPSGNPANNFNNTTSGWLKLNTGKPAPTTVVIEAVNGGQWYVSHYGFKAVHNTSATNLTLAIQGREAQPVAAGVEFVVDETVNKGEEASFVFAGTNGNPLELKDFTVTITYDPDYEAPEFVLPVETDLIVNGQFDEWTTWYNLQFTQNQYALFNNGTDEMTFTGADSGCFLDDSHLWAFVLAEDGESVKIYNKETGVDKVLAAPKGGTGGYPRMMTDGADPNYCYTWKIRNAEYTSAGAALPDLFKNKRAIYISLADNDNAILNNFQNKGVLGFWTEGYGQGSVIVPVVIETKVAIDMKNGSLSRVNGAANPTNRWQGTWTYGGQLNVGFGCTQNNITIHDWTEGKDVNSNPEDLIQIAASLAKFYYHVQIPQDYYVSDVHLKCHAAEENGEVNFYVGSAHEDIEHSVSFDLKGTEVKEVNLTDLPYDFDLQFVTYGENDLPHNVVLEDFTVVIKRHVREYLPVVNVYPRNTVNRQIRIPAITTVGAGEHAGRVITAYDFRWCNADLAAGNIDLTIATSDDNGQTWTAPDFARDADGNPVTEYNHKWTRENNDWGSVQANACEAWDAAWGDAALVADRESADVMMIAVGGPIGFFNSRRDKTQSAIRWISHDGGDTWSPAENMTEKIYTLFDGEPLFAGRIDGMFFGSGRAMQSRYIKVGKYYRVYSVISTQVNGGNTRNYVLYTDDLGENWHVLGSAAQCPVKSNGDEPKCEELPDGSVLLAARGKGGNRNFNVFRYTNPSTGDGKWIGDHINTNMGMGAINACDGEIYILPVTKIDTDEKCYLALQSFPYGGSRANVSIAWKALNEPTDFLNANSFTTWGGRYQVCQGGSAYSTMSLMHNGNIGFFYEMEYTGGAAYDGVFKEIPIETITNGRYTYYADEDNEVALQLTQALVEHRMGAYTGDNADAVEAAGNEYLDNPTYANYIKFNRAEYGDPVDHEADDYDFAYEKIATWPGLEGTHPVVDDLTLSDETLNIFEGDKATLVPSETKNIIWTTSDKSVCTVTKAGVVKAVAPGVCEIKAVAPGDRPAVCTVTVAPKPVLSVNPESVVLEVGDTATLEAKPENAPEGEEPVVTWTSSNELVATVADGVVTAVGVGEAIITATWGDLTATVAVTVNAKSDEDGINEIGADKASTIYDVRGIRHDKTSHGVYIINGKKVVK